MRFLVLLVALVAPPIDDQPDGADPIADLSTRLVAAKGELFAAANSEETATKEEDGKIRAAQKALDDAKTARTKRIDPLAAKHRASDAAYKAAIKSLREALNKEAPEECPDGVCKIPPAPVVKAAPIVAHHAWRLVLMTRRPGSALGRCLDCEKQAPLLPDIRTWAGDALAEIFDDDPNARDYGLSQVPGWYLVDSGGKIRRSSGSGTLDQLKAWVEGDQLPLPPVKQ